MVETKVAHSHRSTQNEAARTPPLSSPCPHFPTNTVTLAGNPVQGSKIPTAASASSAPSHDAGSVCEANNQLEVAYYPARPSLFAPLPQLPFHSTYTTPKPTQNAATSSLVQVPLLLDRYHPIQYFSPNILFLCIEL